MAQDRMKESERSRSGGKIAVLGLKDKGESSECEGAFLDLPPGLNYD